MRIRFSTLGHVVLIAAVVSACHPSTPRAPAGGTDRAAATFTWPVPTGWNHETFALPPDFAPTLPYHGQEELRFAPGFYQTRARDYWSYDIVWWLDQEPAFDPPAVETALTSYFRGLAQSVGGTKYRFDPAHFGAMLTLAGSGDSARMSGQVESYDPFTTGLPLTLHVEAGRRHCGTSGHVAVVLAISPRPPADSVWLELRRVAATFQCG